MALPPEITAGGYHCARPALYDLTRSRSLPLRSRRVSCRCCLGRGGFCVPQQDCETPRTVHLAFYKQRMGLSQEVGMMVEVPAGGLHRVHHVLRGKRLAMTAGGADQQSL